MAQRIAIDCDQHLIDDEQVPGATWRVTISGPGVPAKTYDTDACEAHAKPLADLAAWLREHGRPASDGSPKPAQVTQPGEHKCAICGHESPTRSALGAHVRNMHGKSLAETEGLTADRPCPECGQGFASAQGLAVHRSRTHGVRGATRTGKAGGR